MHDAQKTEEKARIRNAMRERRRALPPQAQEEASRRVCAHLVSLDAYKSARCVMAYMACRGEMSLAPAIEDILASGRTLALPRCEAAGIMTARHVQDLSALLPGAYGLPEPGADSGIVDPGLIDLILVPGAAFDRAGGRIGQGGGYYDRFLRGTRAVRAGICHDFALLAHVPAQEHDEKMDCMVTPGGVICRISDNQEEVL
ncbi:MAG: 5-formyltetrahydrofolate cyclo-ligase [Eubacteriales bacterium]|nr:5-formyltetrahydrofolate cyclo-ligase [Eubacteriales bacterium]